MFEIDTGDFNTTIYLPTIYLMLLYQINSWEGGRGGGSLHI